MSLFPPFDDEEDNPTLNGEKLPLSEVRDNGVTICKREDYVKFISRRDFVFPREEESTFGDIPFKPWESRRDFIFPEWVCKPSNPIEPDVIPVGREILEFDLLVTSKSTIITDIETDNGRTLTIEEFIVTEKPEEFFNGREFEAVGLITDSTALDFLNEPAISQGRILEEIDLFLAPTTPDDLRRLFFYNGTALELDDLNFSQTRIVFINIDMRRGNTLDHDIQITNVQTPVFQPYNIGAYSSFISCSFIDTPETIFDWYSPCCFEDGTWYGDDVRLYHEMAHKEYPNREVFITGGRRFEPLDLATQINVTDLWAYRGTVFWINEEDETLPIQNANTFNGRYFDVTFDWKRETNFCELPQEWFGDDLVIEMAEILDDSCRREYIHQGREFALNTLFTSFSFEADTYTGRILEAEIFTFTWESTIYQGRDLFAHVALDHIYEDVLLSVGREWDGWFYEPTIDIDVGRFLECEISTRYYVEFLEYGCLDNEHIYTDKAGYRLDYLTIEAPVEFLPYDHYIKARCF